MKIVDFSLKKRVTMSMVVLVIVILGMISFTKLGLDMLPDMDYPYITVITTYGGVSSEDIEQNITRPVEQWISTVSGIKKLQSVSLEGQSVVMVEFEWGTNLDFAAQDVRDTIGMYSQYLPDGADEPFVMKFNFSQMPIIAYGITGDGTMNLSKLRDYVDNEVATRLERIEGVASTAVFSPEMNEVLVSIDKGKLESRGVNIGQVEGAIQASNVNLPAGYMTENHKEFLLRSMGEFKTFSEIGDILVGMSRSGAPIFLKDLGTVKEAPKESRLKLRMNGQPGIMMMVTKSSGANSVLVAREVKKVLAQVEPTLKGETKFHVWLDMSRIIEMMSNKSTINIIEGGLLAMLIIFLFLRNLKPTIAIGITIPLSIVVAFIAFYIMGYTLNLITLGGLALGVGMLVDNAVVVIENIFRHLQEGMTPTEAARKGTSEVGLAITGSTLTTVAVFFPMVFATGIAGRMAQSLAVSVIIALMASLFVALTIVPMLAAWMFRVHKKKGQQTAEGIVDLGEDKFTPVRDRYEGWLRKALVHRKKVLIGIIAAFVLSMVGAAFLGTEFMPATDSAMLYLKISMPVGTNVEETDRIVKYMENESLKDPNVITTFVQVGTSEQSAQDTASGTGAAGSYEAIIYAYLKPSGERKESDKQILERWRRSFPTLENSRITAIDIAGASMMGTSTNPIEIQCFGRDMGRLERIAESVRARIVDIKGLRDVKVSLEKSKPELQLHIKKEEASKLGLTPYAISSQVRTYTIGTVVSRMILEGEDRDIRVQLKESDRTSIEDLRKLPIQTPTGPRSTSPRWPSSRTFSARCASTARTWCARSRSGPTSSAATWARSSRRSRKRPADISSQPAGGLFHRDGRPIREHDRDLHHPGLRPADRPGAGFRRHGLAVREPQISLHQHVHHPPGLHRRGRAAGRHRHHHQHGLDHGLHHFHRHRRQQRHRHGRLHQPAGRRGHGQAGGRGQGRGHPPAPGPDHLDHHHRRHDPHGHDHQAGRRDERAHGGRRDRRPDRHHVPHPVFYPDPLYLFRQDQDQVVPLKKGAEIFRPFFLS